jgi:cysteine desulfurase
VEHSAVLNTLQYMKRRFGIEVTLLPVDGCGMVDPDLVRDNIRPNTVLITVMHANNEVGTIQPVHELARVASEHEVVLHVDAAQSAGKVPIDLSTFRASLLSIAGHKLYGPKGTGAVFIRAGTEIDPLVHGSGQEHGLRAGTEAVAATVALGAAAEIARDSLAGEIEHVRVLRDRLFELLAAAIPGLLLNGHPVQRLPNTLNVSFPGVSGAALLQMCPSVAASTGSACHSASPEPSAVLLAMGLGIERAIGAVRLSLGRWSTADDIEHAAEGLVLAYRSVAGARFTPA